MISQAAIRGRRRRQANRERGLCSCGRPPVEGKRQCASCDQRSVRLLEQRRKRAESGQCATCSKPVEPGYRTCLACRSHRKTWPSTLKDYVKEGGCRCGGVCVRGKSRCKKCLVKQKELARKRRLLRKEQRLCPNCSRQVKGKFVYCMQCRLKKLKTPSP